METKKDRAILHRGMMVFRILDAYKTRGSLKPSGWSPDSCEANLVAITLFTRLSHNESVEPSYSVSNTAPQHITCVLPGPSMSAWMVEMLSSLTIMRIPSGGESSMDFKSFNISRRTLTGRFS